MANKDQKLASVGDSEERIVRIIVSRTRRNEKQPRIYFSMRKLEDLAKSIKEKGQKVAIIVRRVRGDPKHDFEIIDGERRWRAHQIAGISTIMAVVREVELDEEEVLEQSVIASVKRENHTDREIAWVIERMEKFASLRDFTIEERLERIGKAFGRGASWVRGKKGLLRLHHEIQAMMAPVREDGSEIPEEEVFNGTIAIFISNLHHDLQLKIAKEVMEKRMTLNQARTYARQLADEAGAKAGNLNTNPPGLPKRSWQRLQVMARITREGLGFLATPSIRSVLKKADPKDRVLMATELDQLIVGLNELKGMLLEVPIVQPLPTPAPPPPPAPPPAPKPVPVSSPTRKPAPVVVLSVRQATPTRPTSLPPPLKSPAPKPSASQLPPPSEYQRWDLSNRVLAALFYSGGHRQVNLSESELKETLRPFLPSGADIRVVVKDALKDGRSKWGALPHKGSDQERLFVITLGRFRKDYGMETQIDDAFDIAKSEDSSNDP